MLNVQWMKNQAGSWLPLETFNLATVTDAGVYIIWHAGNPGRVVYVGQGDIRSRLGAHRVNNEITKYRASGTLYVTWAAVPAAQRDGVERHLADHWNPLVGDAHPIAQAIAVNSPW
jgi:hypothetical protein